MSKFKKVGQVFGKMGTTLTKHSPVIFTAIGVAGIGATAIASYKAKDKIEAIVDKTEENNAKKARLEEVYALINDTERRLSDAEYDELHDEGAQINSEIETYTKVDIAKDVAGAVALPVLLGVGSISCIILSYQIQNNRIGSLAAALATSATENAIFKKKYKTVHGEEAYTKFANTKQETVKFTDDKGKEKEKEVDVKDLTDSLTEYWYDESEHYVSDDNEYNLSYINEKLSTLDLTLFQRGVLPLNAALQALGFAPTKAGSSVGWTSGNFQAETRRVTVWNRELGRDEEQLLVVFSQPSFIYDKEDYTATLMGMC